MQLLYLMQFSFCSLSCRIISVRRRAILCSPSYVRDNTAGVGVTVAVSLPIRVPAWQGRVTSFPDPSNPRYHSRSDDVCFRRSQSCSDYICIPGLRAEHNTPHRPRHILWTASSTINRAWRESRRQGRPTWRLAYFPYRSTARPHN